MGSGAAYSLLLLGAVVACSDAPRSAGHPSTVEASAPTEAGPSSDAGSHDGSRSHPVTDAVGSTDAPSPPEDAGAACSVDGAPGNCMLVSECSAISAHSAFAGYCPGPADVECCIVTPSVADNPPVPSGWQLMPQSAVTAAMTTWAVAVLHDPTTYPLFSTTIKWFGSLKVMARVEWHPPDFNNSAVHRGVTLYEPI